MSKIILYGIEASPPVRAILLTLKALNLDYEFREVDLFKGGHLTEEFLKKNPQHTVPVLEDDGQFLWDSHSIAAYLVRKYGKNDDLYPKDFHKRAIVDQRLHFDSGVFFPSLRNITFPIWTGICKNVPQEKIDAVHQAFDFLETFLEHDYLAGDSLTIADFSAVSTATSFDLLAPIDSAKYPKVVAWINRISKLPYYEEANAKGVVLLNGNLKKLLL
ncbi:glutathione S-transferase 1-like [Episyrphus balteatus]|uniref:glutathione S-transferase 1-like n=1 Tax=Episyrphus balteatus TaxID=286459 RepID=UPI002485C0E6|nr:glutathione S-transferase 1-like [Episyrphus balteatus]